jgi:hypothetical protein
MKPEYSLPCSQEPAYVPYPEPDECRPPIYVYVSHGLSSLYVFRLKGSMHVSSSSWMLYVQPILAFLIWQRFHEEYKMWSSYLRRLIFFVLPLLLGNSGNSLNIVSDYRLVDRGSISGRGEGFSSSLCVQTGSEANPASHAMDTGGKAWPRRDANHPLPSSADVKNELKL